MTTEMTTVVISFGGYYGSHDGVSVSQHTNFGDTIGDRTESGLVHEVSTRLDRIFDIQNNTQTKVEPSDEQTVVEPSDADAELESDEELLELSGDLGIVQLPTGVVPFCRISTCPMFGTETIVLDLVKIYEAVTELSGDATLSDEEKVRRLRQLAELRKVDLMKVVRKL